MTEREVRADFIPDHCQFSTGAGDAYAFTTTSGPYEYLLGALSGCLFLTFRDIAREMRVSYEHVSFATHGTKRDEVPAWLESCSIHMTVTGADDPAAFIRAMEKATETCSIYQMISRVAEMTWSAEFT